MILPRAPQSGCKLLSEWARCQGKEGGGEPRQGLESRADGQPPLSCGCPVNIPALCTSHGVKPPWRGALDITDHNCILTRAISVSLRENHRSSRDTLQIPVYSSLESIDLGLAIVLGLTLSCFPRMKLTTPSKLFFELCTGRTSLSSHQKRGFLCSGISLVIF